MPTPAQIHDDIQFWLGNQDREHMLFLSLGIVDPMLKAEASRLYDAYERARATGSDEALLALAGPSQALKTAAYDAANRGWIGWLFPLFYDHTRREIEYALARIQSNLTAQDEACFWTRIGAEHAAMAAQFLDPTQGEIIMQGLQKADALDDLHEACQQQIMPTFIALSRQAAVELDAYFSAAERMKVKSVIHPALAAHIVREGQRFIATMTMLQQSRV